MPEPTPEASSSASAATVPTTETPAGASSRSPSPPAPPPVGEAPGIRAQGLINVFNGSLNATVKKCSYENFAMCFPTAAKYAPDVLDQIWRQFTAQLGDVARSNFDAIVADRNVIPSLNSLDNLIAEAKKRKERAEAAAVGGPVDPPVPPHTLPPETLHLAHLQPFLDSETARLDAKLSELQCSNISLAKEIAGQRREMEALLHGLEAVVRDLEASAAMLNTPEVSELVDDIRSTEDALQKAGSVGDGR